MLTAAAAPAGQEHCTSLWRRNLHCALTQTESGGKEWGKRKDKGREKRKRSVGKMREKREIERRNPKKTPV